MTELFNKAVTIYNDIAAESANPRRWDRCVVYKCNIQGGKADEANSTVVNVVNAKNVITKDVAHYKPYLEYIKLPEETRSDYFTAKVGDFIIFEKVDDVVATAQEFSQLQQKYKDSSIKVTSFSASVYGMPVDHVRFTNS